MNQYKYLNAEKILRVQVVHAKKTSWFKWEEAVPERKFLWFVSQPALPAGWSDGYYDKRYDEDYVLKNSSVASKLYKNTEVLNEHSIWDKPYVVIESEGGKYTNTDYVYFETNIEAELFSKEVANKFPHIVI
jgi:hypothetical protein